MKAINTNKQAYLQQVKQQNISAVLNVIWEHQSISRVEMIKKTGLTSGTISNLTKELIQLGIIREYEAVSGTVGRRRIMLGFNPDSYRIIGIDIGRSTIEVVLTDLTGNVLLSVEENIAQLRGPDQILAVVDPHVNRMKEKALAGGGRVLGIGTAVPGPMDLEKGIILSPPNFLGWDGYPLRDELTRRYSLPAHIEDDSCTCALAERWYGIGRNSRDLVFITMGMGIGGGIVTKGELVRGTNGLYGQVGHMTIVPDGEKCACGNYGCWETVGAIQGILKRSGGARTMDELMRHVREGNPQATECMERTLQYLEIAIINVFAMYDPEQIVLGGRLYPYLSDHIIELRKRVRERTFSFVKDRVHIASATFGTSQSVIGATAVVFGKLLTSPLDTLFG
ncbi:ROK family transcriptional regulator [Paenibacillus spongiae]|uniref:ROK family transcriptional regulator n=1 Tax=Paenibacillus spongiae TaxID=2909671 RepID=A0ABY5S521_9BACL|nr:ROK family transcriptional regulator [Paenibacillus spongiae]UVI27940.1 ROK family transcriptional regulator [Paenibacillus spongiae]